MESREIDVAVVGAGAAGITAALYAKRKALSVRIFEAEALGGQAAEAIWVENYPGISKLEGAKLMQRMAEHLKEFGVEVEEAAEATGIKKLGKGKGFELDINNGEERVQAKTVILCTGSKYKTLGIPGEKEFYGKGLSYCATCDGPAFKGRIVAVVGAGNSGVNAALFFSEICSKTYLVEFMPKPCYDAVYSEAVKKSGIELMLNTEATEIAGNGSVEGIKLKGRKDGKEKALAVDGVFIYVGTQPRNALAKKLGLKTSKKGYIVTDGSKATSMEGVFAAGDITGELAQIVTATGSGAVAATSAFEYLKKQK
ncbi:MAG: FAD-dependent oxidoreductase [Candidatus Diapherotrites archaeon]|uniref:FAD-dependent oxidoreductase n=1 Tax=Candidatus Iainarchaeum sp. TaxID=3101447 RepID=A0A938YUG8_9ARCH|nr:FAD-dependent oxidoreductase [Candidatus Diapherotrites archaeon]